MKYSLTYTNPKKYKLVKLNIDWSTYWNDRYISFLSVETTGQTTQTVNAVIVGTGYTGVSYEYSEDGINYSVKGVSATGTYLATGLTLDTLYYWRARLYYFGRYSDYSNIYKEYAGLWYLAGGINPTNVLGIYKFSGATSENASLVNLVNPGTNNLVKMGLPVWNKTTGWGGFNDTNYLIGPIYKTRTYSVIQKVCEGNLAGLDYGRSFAAEPDVSGNHGVFIIPVLSDGNGYMRCCDDYAVYTKKGTGVFGITQSGYFIDGFLIDSAVPTEAEENIISGIGNNPTAVGADYAFSGNVIATVIYKVSITDAQMIAVQNRMLFQSFEMPARDFTSLTRYDGNPIILQNTETFNIYGADTPYVRIENKVDNIWYAPTQVAVNDGYWWDIAMYKSTDLITWQPHGNNPIISAVDSTWEENLVIHPSLIKIGSTWYLYYSGWSDTLGRIGLATSPDLINWTKHPANPIYVPPTGHAGVPCVIKIGMIYFMYYTTATYAANTSLICYATSPDGIAWTYGGICFRANGILVDRGMIDSWINQRSDGIYEMVCTRCIFIPSVYQDIIYATSYDGAHWIIRQNVILRKGIETWEAAMIGDPVLADNPITHKGNLFYVGIAAGVGETPGTSGAVAILNNSKVGTKTLILGNSIAIIPTPDNIIWWGTWGVAASIAENDFAHQLENLIQANNPDCIVTPENIAAWEAAHIIYDKTNFDGYFVNNPDLVIIKIGENVTDETDFDISIQELIDYVKEQVPDARIIICGTFWGDFSMETFLQDAATANGLTYVSLSALNIPANCSSIGATVYGDDGNPHLVNNAGVAAHPNDTGMAAIATEIFNAL
jgi:hypothetical protein